MNNFQSECEKAISSISDEDIKKFNQVSDHGSRIKIIFNYINIGTEVLKETSKNAKIAETEKANGNRFFSGKDYQNAIKSYNLGILNCPQNDDSYKQLLAILVANRSAAFFEIHEYKKVLDDIDYILEIDKYPKHLLYKIWLRKAKCYDALQNQKSANELYQQAYEYIKFHSELSEKDISSKIENIKANRKKLMQYFKEESPRIHGEECFVPNRRYPAAHSDIYFDQDDFQGKFARAAKDIPAGQIILEETPHCFVLNPENNLTNCQNCLVSTEQIFPCPNCPSVVFCSSICERTANETYHKYECSIQKTLFESGASINCALALRIITQKSLKFFNGVRLKLNNFLKDNCDITPTVVDPYKSENYRIVFFLCRNENARTKEELLHLTMMSIYLFKLLRNSEFFPKRNTFSSDDITLSEDEIFIMSLIVRHLELLQFNCHEIAELRRKSDGHELHCTGAGLYPTAALFNHSCDPSVIRYNSKKKLIIRSIKPIKKGEIIYENYGPIYTSMKREFRQQFLKERYRFDCTCLPCTEFWPHLDKMDEKEMRIECKKCSNIFIIDESTFQPFLICNMCGKNTKLFPILKNLMSLQEILPSAEELYKNGQFTEAIQLFLQALNIAYDNLKPPCPDMIKIQQRLRTCFVHYGNKKTDYKFLH